MKIVAAKIIVSVPRSQFAQPFLRVEKDMLAIVRAQVPRVASLTSICLGSDNAQSARSAKDLAGIMLGVGQVLRDLEGTNDVVRSSVILTPQCKIIHVVLTRDPGVES